MMLGFFYTFVFKFNNKNKIKMKKVLLSLVIAFSFTAMFLEGNEQTKPVKDQIEVFSISTNFP